MKRVQFSLMCFLFFLIGFPLWASVGSERFYQKMVSQIQSDYLKAKGSPQKFINIFFKEAKPEDKEYLRYYIEEHKIKKIPQLDVKKKGRLFVFSFPYSKMQLEIINWVQGTYQLNGYSLKYDPQKTLKERLKYYERILKKTDDTKVWNWLIPKVYGSDEEKGGPTLLEAVMRAVSSFVFGEKEKAITTINEAGYSFSQIRCSLSIEGSKRKALNRGVYLCVEQGDGKYRQYFFDNESNNPSFAGPYIKVYRNSSSSGCGDQNLEHYVDLGGNTKKLLEKEYDMLAGAYHCCQKLGNDCQQVLKQESSQKQDSYKPRSGNTTQ